MMDLQNTKIRYYAVFDSNNNYFNGNSNYDKALEELNAYRAKSDVDIDPKNVVLVAVLDV